MERSPEAFASVARSLLLLADLTLESPFPPPASLGPMPPEIKLNIVEAYCQPATRREMVRLSLVDSEFAQMARRFLWKDLNVVHASDYNLHRLVSTLTLTNARFTHSVSLGSIPGFDEYYDYNRPCDAVEYGRITPRRTLLTTLIERLRDLVRLSFDVSLARGLSRSHVEQMSSSLVSSSSSSRIQKLEVTSDEQRDSVDLDDFSCFIDNLPHLRHLTIHFRENFNVRLHSFSLAVASLRHLQVLEYLDSAYLVGERWKLSPWPWTCLLKELLIGEGSRIDFDELLALLLHFAATLRRVRIHGRDEQAEAGSLDRVEAWCKGRGVEWESVEEENEEDWSDGDTARDCIGYDKDPSNWD